MGANAISLQIQTNKPAEALRRIGSGLLRLQRPAGILGFVSGSLASCLQSLAEGAQRQFPGLPALFASSDGAFTDQGELTDQDGIACLLLGGKPLRVSLGDENPWPNRSANEESPNALATQLRACPSMLLASSQLGPPDHDVTRRGLPASAFGWFGAVTSSDARIWGVDVDGRVGSGKAGLVAFPALESPLLVAASSCRLITQSARVSSAEGNVVFELDGVPALVALGQASSKLVDRSWIVVALSPEPDGAATPDGTLELLFRPIRGVDPARGAIVLNDRVNADTTLAFAVRDDRASRRSLEEALRGVKHRLCGGAPRFGIYFDGLGRGRSLYGANNVDLGLIRNALGDFPILGMRSAFELRGDVGTRGIQTLSGQLALFRNPS